jgi:hypothetical protein
MTDLVSVIPTWPPGTTKEASEPARRKSKNRKKTKYQLLTHDKLDGRSNAAKYMVQLIHEIETYLGGHAKLSPLEQGLVESFAGARVMVQNLNCRLVQGEARTCAGRQ